MKALRERYVGRVAAEYEASRDDAQWRWERECLAEELDELAPGALLDVPCGTGRFWPLYEARGIDAVGVDLSRDMLTQAAAKGWQEIQEGDVFALPFGADSFDVAVCFRLLNWMERADCVAALREIGRVAGQLVASVGLGSGMRGRTRLHGREVFRDAGWAIQGERSGAGHDRYRIVTCSRC